MCIALLSQDDASFLEGRSVSGDHGDRPIFGHGHHSLTDYESTLEPPLWRE
jgi:hypothetical protein